MFILMDSEVLANSVIATVILQGIYSEPLHLLFLLYREFYLKV